MRLPPRAAPAGALIGLCAALAGCSSGGSQDTLSTASLAPRPHEGMVGDTPQRYPDGAAYGRPYATAPRKYVDPGHPTPREFAAAHPYYDTSAAGGQRIETGSLGGRGGAYKADARWRRPAPITTGATGYAPHIVEVREGDTLFSLSRRYQVPVGELVAANRLPSERIAIGQRLVIPQRYR